MAVSIDKVYQTVLALANKEQRGYISPQEFNLFADHAQVEIFEQYFYDLDQFSRLPGTDQLYADKIKNLREKTDLFQTYSPARVELVNDTGFIKRYDHTSISSPGVEGSDLYRFGSILVSYKSKGYENSIEAQYITTGEYEQYSNTKLLKRLGINACYDAPSYRLFTRNETHYIQIHPFPVEQYIDNTYTGTDTNYLAPDGNRYVFPDTITIFYTRKPKKPNWAYVVVNEKPLYDSSLAQDFELHESELNELIYRILLLAGIAIEKPQITQAAAGLQGAQVQQEKQ